MIYDLITLLVVLKQNVIENSPTGGYTTSGTSVIIFIDKPLSDSYCSIISLFYFIY